MNPIWTQADVAPAPRVGVLGDSAAAVARAVSYLSKREP